MISLFSAWKIFLKKGKLVLHSPFFFFFSDPFLIHMGRWFETQSEIWSTHVSLVHGAWNRSINFND